MEKIMYRDNSVYHYLGHQPYMNNTNQYIIYYDRYTLLHYARRTAGDKYTFTYSKHVFLVDVSNVDVAQRPNFVSENWISFVWQIIDYNAYNKGTGIDNDPSSYPIAVHPHEANGNYKLNTLYTTRVATDYKYPTLYQMYSELLIRFDIAPSALTLQLWSGYDNSRSANEIQYYNSKNFLHEVMSLNR